jgi:predicted aspartyl protease
VLLLDTGATVTSISPGIAGQLNIDPARTQKSIGQVAGGGLLEVRRAKLAYITVGPYTKTDMDVAIIGHKGPPIRYDGLLGMNFLRGLKYSINFDEQTIYWTP